MMPGGVGGVGWVGWGGRQEGGPGGGDMRVPVADSC